MRYIRFFVFIFSVLFISCEKEDTAITLPAPGPLSQLSANMGINYDTLIFVDLSTGATVSYPNKTYDLAFEASADGYRVYLNTGKLMFVAHTYSTYFSQADTAGVVWKTDDDNLHDDSLAVGKWVDNSNLSMNEVMVIDRGRPYYSGAERFRKIVFSSVDASKYTIRFSNFDNSSLTDFTIPKDPNYSLIYFSFDNNGQLVPVAPPKSQWDVVFTRFTHTYYDQPLYSPFRYYLVSGALLNKWNGSLNTILKKDSTENYIPFEELKSTIAQNYVLSQDAAKIGFDWKYYDFNTSLYLIRPDQYYLLKDQEGYYFKIKFIDYYDSQGNKGVAKFQFQRL